MRRYWLIFAQAVTVCLGILFVVTTLRPDLLRLAGPGAAPPVAAASARPTAGSGVGPVSYADGVARGRRGDRRRGPRSGKAQQVGPQGSDHE
jgi:serine protease DegQ